ncbi:hypothetical protein ASPFODRAFT_48954 [Aspergillus luchuensis CBS 106.47]|uniref:Uncharacterized protein n=1 Tax=Aspergillus luchuensis (strain CBS 106.47) TaxID=1137211 RepID=A0A1M3TDL0_ASPLC|nr:hypothetical protein ASPFODRAFT_48954 [Aspergillus luchuensis CBS 106.47]
MRFPLSIQVAGPEVALPMADSQLDYWKGLTHEPMNLAPNRAVGLATQHPTKKCIFYRRRCDRVELGGLSFLSGDHTEEVEAFGGF